MNFRESVDNRMIIQSRPRSLLHNAGWSLVSTGWFTVVGFVLTPFLASRLGASLYGLYVLIMSISGFLGVMDLGLGQATLRYVALYYGRGDLIGVNRSVGATSAVNVLSGTLAWTVLFFGAPAIANGLALAPQDVALGVRLLRLTAFNLGFMLGTGAYGAIPQALQRYDISSVMTVVQSIFQVAGTVALLYTGRGVYELVFLTVITTVVRQIANVVVAKRLIPHLRLLPMPSWAGLKEVFSYGIFATATQVLGIVWREADKLLLGGLIGTASVAYLSVPKSLVFRGTDAVASAAAALFPRFSATNDLGGARRLFLTTTWSLLLATAVIYVPMTVLFPTFLLLWIGPEFARESAWIGQVIAFSCIVRGAYVPYQMLFQGYGKPQYLTLSYFASGLTSLALNLLLIPTFGLAGAGYTYVGTLVIGVISMIVAWRRVLLGESLLPLLRAVVLPAILAFANLLLWSTVIPVPADLGWVGLVGLGILMVAATAGSLLAADLVLGARTSYAKRLWVSGCCAAAPLPFIGGIITRLGYERCD